MSIPQEGSPQPVAPQTADTSAPLRSIARGSAWMIAARWCMRSVGLVSTIILARLLQPSDFGVVAMAMMAVQFVQVFAEAGQDLAVIRHEHPTSEHFDTAWTMSVCAGAIVALTLLTLAPVAGWYYNEPRVVPVILVLALAPLIDGFTNIGAIAGFRRELEFDKEFRFTVVRQLSGAALTIPLALLLQDYWALVIGIIGGKAMSLAASYWMHPFRPRLHLPKFREIWSYSAWMQFAEIGNFFSGKLDQIVIGGLAAASQLGAYSVADNIAGAPTGELVVPAARAAFPVYAKLLHDPARLAQSYLSVLSVVAIIGLSTGFGVALVADDLVYVVLGPKWAVAAPLVPWLAAAAGMVGVARSVTVVLSVTGHARLNAMRSWIFTLLFLPAAIIGGFGWGAEGVAAARTVVTVVIIPVLFGSLMQVIPVTTAQLFAFLWRPTLATLAMAAALSVAGATTVSPVPLRLFCNVGLGAGVFALSLLGLWWLAGRPAGAEEMLLRQAGGMARRFGLGASRRLRLTWIGG